MFSSPETHRLREHFKITEGMRSYDEKYKVENIKHFKVKLF